MNMQFIFFLLFLSASSMVALSETEPVFDLTVEEKVLLEKREPGLRNAVEQAVEEHGEDSQEKADALHKLGGVLYKLGKYQGLRSSAKEIARIESLRGHNTVKLAFAMRNVASVAYRLGLHDESLRYMMRALNILLHHYDAESKEVIYHKSVMMSFEQEKDYTKYPMGMPYKQFKKIEKKQKNIDKFNLDEL